MSLGDDVSSRQAGAVGRCETCGQPRELWWVVDGVLNIERHEHATAYIKAITIDVTFTRAEPPPSR